MRVLITGATGVLGSALAHALVARGNRVVVLSRTPSRLSRLDDIVIESYSYDVAGMEAALAAGNVDAVVHAACAYGRSGETLAELVEANILHPLRLFCTAGSRIGAWISIGTALPRSVSSYALSKWQFADWLAAIPNQQIAPRTLIELEHFYGPRDDPSKFLTRVARACVRGEPLDLTAGTQSRDFIHIHDVVAGVIRVLDLPESGYRAIPMGSGDAVQVRTIVEAIHREAGSRSELRFGVVHIRPQEPQICRADITALKKLGWTPTIPLTTGITELVASESEIYKL